MTITTEEAELQRHQIEEVRLLSLAAEREQLQAENARLREALQKILAEDDQPVCCGNGTYGDYANPPECCNQPIYGLDRAQSIARAALAPIPEREIGMNRAQRRRHRKLSRTEGPTHV